MDQNVLIIGATSGIGAALARELASRGTNLVLSARDPSELEIICADLRLRHDVQAHAAVLDVLDFSSHPRFFEDCAGRLQGGVDGVMLCHGHMGPQADAERDFDEARRAIDVNYTASVSLLHLVAAYFEQRGKGFICAVSSVAGDRGRQSNYVYGSSKAALTTFLAGLRNRLAKRGVTVTTVKPGFVDTSMTWGLPGLFLVAQPRDVARTICRAVERGRDVIYVPWFWRWIMLIIRSVPERIFKKLKL